uniref:Cytadhesion n=1 Tax=Hymenolepis diminuta TaxID=6216 RepID=A0A158QBK1_HYMDI
LVLPSSEVHLLKVVIKLYCFQSCNISLFVDITNMNSSSGSILAGLLGNSGDTDKSQAQKSDSNTVIPSAGMPSGFNFDKPTPSAPDVQAPAAVTKSEPKEPPQMAQSIIAASNQFSKALKSQAEASARAWSHLHNTFDGHFTNFQQTPGENGVGRSVWDIEQSLDNMENFLRVIDE